MKEIKGNLEAELIILACLINFNDEDVKENIFLELEVDDFYYKNTKMVFTYCKALWKNKKPIEIATVMEVAGNPRGLINELTDICKSTPSNANYETYINILKAKTHARTLFGIAKDISENADVDPYKTRDIALAKLSGIDSAKTSELEHIEKASNEVMLYIADLKNGIRVVDGVKTPFQKLNYYLGNFQNGEITIIAARPSVGKSAFVNEIVLYSALKEKKSVALFNLEMSKNQIVLRMYSKLAGKTLYDLTHGNYKVEDIVLVDEQLRQAQVYVDINSFFVEQICRACRVQKKRKGLDLVCVDYLQLVGSQEKYKSRREEIEYVSRQLKLLAMELNIPIIALSQMSRDVEKESREPVLSDLRESGTIEQDATQVLFLHREKTKESKLGYREDIDRFLKILIAKNRNGAIGNIYMKFEADKMQFIEIDKDGNPLKPVYKQAVLTSIKDEEMPF